MYQATASLGLAAESPYKGPIKLSGDPKGASVLILGAGSAGLVAALELRAAGYKVQVLEYREKAGGRNWTLRGGDTYTELGGFTRKFGFDPGLYLNPGPWRIPYHHHAVLDYCKRLGVALFRSICQGCHMPDARGAKGAGMYPALAGNTNLEAAGYPLTVVVHGRKGMPPFGDYLNDEQVAAVVNYVRGHFGNGYQDAVSADDVKAVR